MAFRTNKVPAIEERTVSGSSVSFNSAFALPLKACKVSFSATQAGSGTPSPTNRLAINLAEYAYVNANGINKNIPLYNSYCKGILDATNGIIEEQYFRIAISPNDILQNNNYPNIYAVNMGSSISSEVSSVFMANEYEATEYTGASSMANYTIDGYAGTFNGVQGRYIKWKDERFSNLSDMKNWITDNPLICIVMRSIFQYVNIQPYLDLITQIGNNTFSTDTGTLEITFADLQEKSASGAVATFNTALAMPLSSCNIAVNAWQEGSGDPSPSNVRPIHGFSEVNATRAGKNQFNIANSTNNFYLSNLGTIEPFTGWNLSDYQIIKPNTTYHFKPNSTTGGSAKHGYYDENKNFIGYISSGEQTFTTPSNAYYMRFSYRETSTDIQLEVGSTATAYEPYVTPTIYTIQLGQEVYGAEVDVVNGVAHVTHKRSIIPTITSFIEISGVKCASYSPDGISRVTSIKNDIISEVGYGRGFNKNFSVFHNSINVFHTVDDAYTVEDYNANIAGNYDVYPLDEPFDIQLTPTQIETLIGNNTIFADTGDIDLTYKDLDLAKRGNFREVFKLPS